MLPPELISLVLSFVEPRDLWRVASASRALRAAALDALRAGGRAAPPRGVAAACRAHAEHLEALGVPFRARAFALDEGAPPFHHLVAIDLASKSASRKIMKLIAKEPHVMAGVDQLSFYFPRLYSLTIELDHIYFNTSIISMKSLTSLGELEIGYRMPPMKLVFPSSLKSFRMVHREASYGGVPWQLDGLDNLKELSIIEFKFKWSLSSDYLAPVRATLERLVLDRSPHVVMDLDPDVMASLPALRDISARDIVIVPPRWATDTDVQGLTSARVFAACAGLRELDLGGCALLDDIAPLGACPELRALDISGCPRISSLAGIKRCAGLRRLNIAGTSVRRLKEVRKCHLLRRVTVSRSIEALRAGCIIDQV